MEAVGQLTGGVAHDFNNLLTAVLGNLDLLTPRLANDPAATRFLAAAQRAAETGAKLTEQLLAFSRRQHLQPRAVDLNSVVERHARAADADDRHDDSGHDGAGARPVAGTGRPDANRGRDPQPRDQRARRDAARRNADDRDPKPAPRAGNFPAELGEDNCISLTVRDTGTGMSEEVLAAAVEPFFTTKELGKGSGLGLSQVYGMVQQSNGTMQIESRSGIGTSVHLYLPSTAVVADAGKAAGEHASGERISGRILVVDDNAAVRDVSAQMLRELGYGVAEAESGHAALDALSRGEVYDLLLIDVAMPGLNGIETARRARELHPGLRVLYVTGYADLARPEHNPGGDPLIKKPFRLAELAAEVHAAIRRAPPGAGDNVVPIYPNSIA